MHEYLVPLGALIVVMIIVHILFKVIKFTVGIFLLGIALIVVVDVFKKYFGIDLMAVVFGRTS